MAVNGVSVQTITLTVAPVSADVTVGEEAYTPGAGLTAVAGTETTFALAGTSEAGMVSFELAANAVDSITLADGTLTVADTAAAGDSAEVNVIVNGIVVDTITVSVTAA